MKIRNIDFCSYFRRKTCCCNCTLQNCLASSNVYPQHVTFSWRNRKTSGKHTYIIWTPLNPAFCRPRWLSWMRRLTGDQEVAESTPAEVGNILLWRLIMKYFLRSFSPFCLFKKGSCQFLAKECAQYWLTAWRTKPAQ